MRIFIASILFLMSLAAVVSLSKHKIRHQIPLIAFCILIMIITAFFDAVWIYWDRIERGAELFLHDAISDLNNGILPPLSTDIPEEDKMQIEAMKNNLPRETYTIEYNDFWVRIFEYYVHFEGGKSFLCSVDAPNMKLLFGKTRYKLLRFKEAETVMGTNDKKHK